MKFPLLCRWILLHARWKRLIWLEGSRFELTWAKCRRLTPRIRSAKHRNKRPDSWGPCTRHVHVPCCLPSHHRTFRRLRSRIYRHWFVFVVGHRLVAVAMATGLEFLWFVCFNFFSISSHWFLKSNRNMLLCVVNPPGDFWVCDYRLSHYRSHHFP